MTPAVLCSPYHSHTCSLLWPLHRLLPQPGVSLPSAPELWPPLYCQHSAHLQSPQALAPRDVPCSQLFIIPSVSTELKAAASCIGIQSLLTSSSQPLSRQAQSFAHVHQPPTGCPARGQALDAGMVMDPRLSRAHSLIGQTGSLGGHSTGHYYWDGRKSKHRGSSGEGADSEPDTRKPFLVRVLTHSLSHHG